MKLKLLLASSLLLCGMSPSSQAVTFDFRSTFDGGNVGDFFDGSNSGSATVDGVTIAGAVSDPVFGNPRFNFNFGSSHLGIGVNSDEDLRPTQIEVGEAVSFWFDQDVQIDSVILQVFFLSAEDGIGGPVAFENDAVDLTIGSQTLNIASPYAYAFGDPTTFILDIGQLGFTSNILPAEKDLILAPTFGDGVRLFAINVSQVAVPETASSAALLALGFGGIAALKFRRSLR